MSIFKKLGTVTFREHYLTTDYEPMEAAPPFSEKDGSFFKHEAVIVVRGDLYRDHFPDGSQVILDMAVSPRTGDMVLTALEDGFIFGFLERMPNGAVEIHYPDAKHTWIHRCTDQVFRVVGAFFPEKPSPRHPYYVQKRT